MKRLSLEYPCSGSLEEWMLEVANQRGVTVVERFGGKSAKLPVVPEGSLSSEELVVGICLAENTDYPQMLRAAAQLISRGNLDSRLLVRLARMERVERVLAELAKQALRVEPAHRFWGSLAEEFQNEKPLQDRLLHWTRIAEPVPNYRRVGVKEWRLPR